MVETTCEPNNDCNPDQRLFKAIDARWLLPQPSLPHSGKTKSCPGFGLRASAVVAAARYGKSGECVSRRDYWIGETPTRQGTLGELASGLGTVQSLLVESGIAPATIRSGGVSDSKQHQEYKEKVGIVYMKLTQASTVAALALSVVMIAFTFAGAWWLLGLKMGLAPGRHNKFDLRPNESKQVTER